MKNNKQNYKNITKRLESLADPERAKNLSWFFKTGKGEYGEGDKFLGITVPVMRKVADDFKDLTFSDIKRLLSSPIHEHRFLALVLLVKRYKKGDEKEKVVKFYLANTKKINNWDLVDTSASYILGDYLLLRDKSILYKLAKSDNLWERRISIISTAAFVYNERYKDTLKIAEILLKDKHDLIHKAVGWMLREVGKRSLKTEEDFLEKHAKTMPRTMLRYAIEKFPEKKRKYYLNK